MVEEEEEEDEAKDGVERRKRSCRDLLLWLAMAVTRFKKTFIYRIKLYRNVPVLNMFLRPALAARKKYSVLSFF